MALSEIIESYSNKIRSGNSSFPENVEAWTTTLNSLCNHSKSEDILGIIINIITIENNSRTISRIVEIYDILSRQSIFSEIFNSSNQTFQSFIHLAEKNPSKYKDSFEILLSTFDIHILNAKISLSNLNQTSSDKIKLWLKLLVSLISGEDVQLADVSSRIFADLLRMEYRNEVNAKSLVQDLLLACDKYRDDTIILFRFYAIFSDILSTNDQLFDISNSLGVTERLLDVSRSNDILGLMVIIEYYSKFALTNHGRKHVVASGLLKWLINTSTENSGSSQQYDNSLAPQAIRVFTTILCQIYEFQFVDSSSLSTEEWAEVSGPITKQFIAAAIELMDSRSVNHRLAGAQVVAELAAASIHGFLVVTQHKLALESWACLSHNSGNVELHASIYSTYALVLSKYLNSDEFADKMKAFYETLGIYHPRNGSTTTSILLSASKGPVSEVKYAACGLLSVAAGYSWGILTLLSTDGFLDFLETPDYTRSAREAKYYLLKAIVDNPRISLLNDNVASKIRASESKGPNYLPPKVDVDTMEM